MSDADRNRPFRGKVVIVTGATSGIGEAAALEFADAGAAVVLTGRRANKGLGVAQEIQRRGGTALFVQMDVREEGAIVDAVAQAVHQFGRLDFAFNNAGTGGVGARTAEQTEESWDRVFDINLKAVWKCMKHEIPAMLASGGGAIVNNSSIFGLVGTNLGLSPYVASKHALIGLTKAAALEYAGDAVRVNAVCPGFTHSEMMPDEPGVQGHLAKLIEANVPLQRIATAREVARAVLWLCSQDAGFVTGQALAIDGGWTSR